MFFWVVDDRSSFFFDHLKRAFFPLYTGFLIACFINGWNMSSELLDKTRTRNEMGHQLAGPKIKSPIRRGPRDRQYQSQARSAVSWTGMHDAKTTQLCLLACVLTLRCQSNRCVNIFIVTESFSSSRLFEDGNVVMKICFLMLCNILYVRASAQALPSTAQYEVISRTWSRPSEPQACPQWWDLSIV